jgi:hypothetical protein
MFTMHEAGDCIAVSRLSPGGTPTNFTSFLICLKSEFTIHVAHLG